VFGLGVGEILLILIVALLVFGPNRLPDLARTFGKAMNEFRKASRDLRETFEAELHRMDEHTRPEPKIQPAQKVLEAEFEERPAQPPAVSVAAPPASSAAPASAPPAPSVEPAPAPAVSVMALPAASTAPAPAPTAEPAPVPGSPSAEPAPASAAEASVQPSSPPAEGHG
jgi:sec-independent protein translocase protein TatB